ncbi:hypothetical protein [Yimella sp. NH-Cas1]|uniref:hypothetical protein n=1 Tax=Yimella sp. NH-Cas1 TaxID=2917726 RepID=UPI001EFB2914|nr:hypothetical protein [Yimella sp. NH-Cas1]MCG8656059.1 hypothetical protein [Yimella sp. NH-Cas1]
MSIAEGESPADAVVREVEEEGAGITARIVRSLGLESYDMWPAKPEGSVKTSYARRSRDGWSACSPTHWRRSLAFNNILAHHIPQLARPEGAEDRTALPVSGDDAEAKTQVSELVVRLGFDTVDAGSAAESWRTEPESSAYTPLYLADADTPDQEVMSALSGPVSAAALRDALKRVERVDVAARQF